MITKLFVWTALLIIVGYDIVAYFRGGIPNTISTLLYNAAYTKPYGAIIPGIAGGLFVHLFTGNSPNP